MYMTFSYSMSSLSRLTRGPIATFYRLTSTDSNGRVSGGDVSLRAKSVKKQTPALTKSSMPLTSLSDENGRSNTVRNSPVPKKLTKKRNRILGSVPIALPNRKKCYINLLKLKDGFHVELSNQGIEPEYITAVDLQIKLRYHGSYTFYRKHVWEAKKERWDGVKGSPCALQQKRKWASDIWIDDTTDKNQWMHNLCEYLAVLEQFNMIRDMSERQKVIMRDSERMNKEVDDLPFSEDAAKAKSEQLVKYYGNGAMPTLEYMADSIHRSYASWSFNFRDITIIQKEILRQASLKTKYKYKPPKEPIGQSDVDRHILLCVGVKTLCKDWTTQQMEDSLELLKTDVESAYKIYRTRLAEDMRLGSRLYNIEIDYSNSLRKKTIDFESVFLYQVLEKIARPNCNRGAVDCQSEPPFDWEEFENLFHEISKKVVAREPLYPRHIHCDYIVPFFVPFFAFYNDQHKNRTEFMPFGKNWVQLPEAENPR